MAETKPYYPLPRLAELDEKLKSVTVAMDTVGHRNQRGRIWVSGSVSEGTHKGYIFPIVSFMSTDREYVEGIAHAMKAPVYVHDRSPYHKPLYITIATHEYAVATILHLRPHLTRWGKRADEILKKYRESPKLPILPAVAG